MWRAMTPLDFLLTRRSRPARTLGVPIPDRATLETILTAAVRVPDHGKLEPFRLIVLGPEARAALAALVPTLATDQPSEKVEKARMAWVESPLAVAVIASPKPDPKVPPAEQAASAACVALSLVNAATAAGYGANWLTGFVAYHPDARAHLGLGPQEAVMGLVHIGTPMGDAPDRPRPDLARVVDWRA